MAALARVRLAAMATSRVAAAAQRTMATAAAPLKKTALHDFHVENGARMVPYAGWSMPVQYPDGVLASHHHVRTKAGLFDVSHMGQLRLVGANALEFMERLVPGNLLILKPGAARLSCYTNEAGGVIDDTVITRNADGSLYVVVNAGCYDKDMAHFAKHLALADEAKMQVGLEVLSQQSLLALQGPSAVRVLGTLLPSGVAGAGALDKLGFMHGARMVIGGIECYVTRCGYTGEDGVEISVPSVSAVALAKALLAAAPDEVRLAGLGPRDSLRLEAGLCLYGNDLDESITPIEAGLSWFVGKRRQLEGGFLGAETILRQMRDGASKLRVGLFVDGAPVRQGAKIFAAADPSKEIGVVTSGVPSPTLGRPIAMGYVATAHIAPGTAVQVAGRKGLQSAQVTQLPFVKTNYFRSK